MYEEVLLFQVDVKTYHFSKNGMNVAADILLAIVFTIHISVMLLACTRNRKLRLNGSAIKR